MAPQGGQDQRRDSIPPTAVRLLPVLIVTFALNVLIDQSTEWPMLLRWGVALAGGVAVQFVVLRLWASRQR
ncbi:hypothetical protein F7P69_07180 [Cellulosimicrobium funkei]|nr:hypothetical protein [Cellulosimicrobium funkei]